MVNYINRDDWAGKIPGILNVEELATIWHFPVEASVKAPLIQKAPGRKAEPPMHIPIGEEVASERILEPIFAEAGNNQKSFTNTNKNSQDIKYSAKLGDISYFDQGKGGAPPANLPIG